MAHITSLKKLLAQATGPIDFTFTNDYMFRACLQDNPSVLKALTASLLHLNVHEIQTVIITNPIELGDAIDIKDFILDIPDAPEFYSHNLMMNTKNHKIYSDKFDIRVLDLTCIHLAAEEDKKYHIDDWARLFKATTWENIRMVAQNNTHLGEAAQTLYKMNADEMVRLKCLARLDYEREQARYEYTLKRNKEMEAEIADLTAVNANLTAEIEALKAQLQSTQ